MDKIKLSIFKMSKSLYFWSCIVYLVYTMQIMAIDYCHVTNKGSSVTFPAVPAIPDDPSTPEDETYAAIDAYDVYTNHEICNDYGLATINKQFIAAGVIHLLSAVMYLFAWYPWMVENWSKTTTLFRFAILLPEFLNIIEAAIYIRTADLYAPYSIVCLTYTCKEYVHLHALELAAASVNFVASVLWLWQWYATFIRGPGRGLSPFDVDFYAQLLLLVPSAIYVAYNVQVSNDLESYGPNKLYKSADVVYFVGAVLYVIGAMRDNDFFFFLSSVPGCVLPEVPTEKSAVVAISSSSEEESIQPSDSTLVIRNIAADKATTQA